jgi:outer membrane protein
MTNRLKTIFIFLSLMGIVQSMPGQKALSLNDAMEIALQNSPDILASRLNMEINRQNLEAQLASLKSQFSLNVTPFHYEKREVYNTYFSKWNTEESKTAGGSLIIAQPIRQTDGTIVLRNDLIYQDSYSEAIDTRNKGFSNNLYIEFNQPLFTYNRAKMNLERTQLSLENAVLSYSVQMLSLEKLVTQAFYYIYQKQMALKIALEEYDNQVISLAIMESKVEAGLAAREEHMQAELNLSTSKSNLDNIRVDLANEKDQFKLLLGLPISDDVAVDADVEYKPVLINLEKAIEFGLAERMELRQRKINIAYAEFELIQSSALNEFKADLNLSFGLMGNNERFLNIYDKPTRSPVLGITFAIPIFDWGQRKARIKASKAEVETQEIYYTNEENNIVLNIRKIFRNLENLVTQIEIAGKNVLNAQLTYEINLERYKNGDLTSMDLNRYQTQLSEKKMDLSNALINYKLELLNMKIQSLWDFEKNSSFIPADLLKKNNQNNENQNK